MFDKYPEGETDYSILEAAANEVQKQEEPVVQATPKLDEKQI